MDNKNDFIASAIADVQANIRAIDVKSGLLLAAMAVPARYFNGIYEYLDKSELTFFNPCFFYLMLLFWLAVVFFLLRAIAAIDNPAIHVSESDGCKGSYYGGGVYKLSFLDAFYNREKLKSRFGVSEFSSKYPNSDPYIKKELTFEHMKLVYIREMKNQRLNFAFSTINYFLLVCIVSLVAEFFCQKWWV